MRANIVEIGTQDVCQPTLDQNTSKMPLSDVFVERTDRYLNKFTLFIAYFNSIPSYTNELEIDCVKANAWFYKNYKDDVQDVHSDMRHFDSFKRGKTNDIYYVLFDEIIVQFDF